MRFPAIVFTLVCSSCLWADDQGDYFENHVRPILVEHCIQCHGGEKAKAGVRLDTVAMLKKGFDGNALFTPGKPKDSRLLEVLLHTSDVKMPPKKKLSDEQINHVKQWIERGAKLPETKAAPAEAWKSHWAFQPLKPRIGQPLPQLIESLVSEAQIKAKLTWAPQADRRTLLRRAKFDLIGLPPSFDEMEKFVHDSSSDEVAFAKVIDGYLASPHFGERWGRHWLDLARYADNKGYIGVGVDRTYPFAWTYRDWVVNSLNRDLPYDQFLSLQLAADQLVRKDNQQDLAAMGFLTVGRRFIGNIHDIIDDRIDVTMRTMQGLTVQCARCHDHKYDPISAKDYYSLYGVFQSSREPELDEMPLLGIQRSEAEQEAFQKELTRLKKELTDWEQAHEKDRKEKPIQFGEQRKPYENRIKQLHANHPGAPPRGMILKDKDKPVEPVLFIRGNPGNRGTKLTRHFPAFMTSEKEVPFKMGSGRLELAQSIVKDDNPLTARVWANRVWEHLVGKPLVNTPSDFGLRSQAPDHPELLDTLAQSLIAEKWSTKKLIRAIMLSRVYRQSVDHAASWQADPDNKWLARMNRKRLEWEPLRDSLLAVSGQLDMTLGGPSVDLFKNSKRRSLYAFIDRQNLPTLFRTFDMAIPDTHSPSRFSTVVPQQTLYFMNSTLVMEQSKALLEQPSIKKLTDPTERIHACYRQCLARQAEPAEVELGLKYLRSQPDEKAWQRYVQALFMLNEFVLVD